MPGSPYGGNQARANTDEAAVAAIGSYELGPVLGRGAVATVYRARRDGRAVALKVIHKDFIASSERDDVLVRLYREAEICRDLNHPNVVRVYDVGESPDLAWLAMELVEGRDLKAAVDSLLPLQERLGLFLELLDALDHVHGHGIVHRDVKPGNALITAAGRLKLADFGIARVPVSDATVSGAILGTPAYMSPEQVLGQPVDHRADLYAAGATLFYALTRNRPFDGSLAEVMHAVLHRLPPVPSSVCPACPPAFDSLVARAMAKRPEDRFSSAAAFAAAIRQALPQALCQPPATDDDATIAYDARTVLITVPQDAAEEPFWRQSRRLLDLLASIFDTPLDASRMATLRASGETLLQGGDTAERSVLATDLTVLAGRLRSLVLQAAPLPGRLAVPARRGDWLELVEVLGLLAGWLRRMGGDEAAGIVAGTVDDLGVAVMRYVREVHAQVVSPDHVEVPRVTANLLRLDILEWGLEILAADEPVRDLRIARRMIACEVMRKVSASIRELTASADPLARFDVASMLTEMEELIALAVRAVDEDPGDGQGAYARTMGRDVLGDFIVSSRGLVAFSREELLGQGTAGAGATGVFAGNLRQLGRLCRFSIRLDEPELRPALRDLTADIHAVVGAVAARLETALQSQGPSPWLYQNLMALHDVAEELGRLQIARALRTRVRDGMATGAGVP